jgi:hypothetical protein
MRRIRPVKVDSDVCLCCRSLPVGIAGQGRRYIEVHENEMDVYLLSTCMTKRENLHCAGNQSLGVLLTRAY